MNNDRRKDKRRDIGGKRVDDGGFGLKKALLIAGIILILGLIAFFVTIQVYNKSLEKVYSDLETDKLGQNPKNENVVENTKEASSKIGKTVNEVKNEAKAANEENRSVNENKADVQKENSNQNVSQKQDKENETKNNVDDKENKTETKSNEKNPEFELPVEGEMMKEFAKDKLVYSETLKEWVIHTGVDIKAEKTTVVKAAEDGKITAIKNDPRYGITVIIEHSNGYETRYANLLTAEFVNIGENVKKGQTIGTVGNTAAFEVLDDYHLHFEILKDGEYQDPIFYVNI